MDNRVDFSLSVYQDLFHKTEQAISLSITTMPPLTAGSFTDGYLRGVIFHWWLMANEYGLSASVIEEEERYFRKMAGLPEQDEPR